VTFTYARWKGGRHWAVYRPDGSLVTVCVYKKGAKHLAGLLQQMSA